MTIIGELIFGGLSAVIILVAVWWGYRVYRAILPAFEIEAAYKLKRIRIEIEKRGIDFEEMLDEYEDFVAIFKRRKKRGVLDSIDHTVEGDLDEIEKKEEPEKGE